MAGSAATRFPEGVAGPHLDAIARRALREVGRKVDAATAAWLAGACVAL